MVTLHGLSVISRLAAAADSNVTARPGEQVLSHRQARFMATREASAPAEKARLDVLKVRGPKAKMRNPELAKFDADWSGFLEPEEIVANQAELARRKAEASKK